MRPEDLAGLTPQQLEVLRRRLARRQGGGEPRPARRGIERVERSEAGHPLSSAQQRLWFLQQLDPSSAAYSVATAAEITGPLEVRAFADAFAGLGGRHEALRTRFFAEDGTPRQVALPELPLALRTVDLTALPEDDREARGRRLLEELAARPFDLARPPLIHGLLVRLGARRHLFALVLHHIIADGSSVTLLLGELVVARRAYAEGRPAPLPEPPVQYLDFAAWSLRPEVEASHARGLEFWQRLLEGAPEHLDLPTDFRRRDPVGEAARVPLTLGPEIRAAVTRLCRRLDTTPFVVLHAAFAALLGRWAEVDDVVLGSAVAGRPRPEVQGVVGPFVNALVLRTDLGGGPTFEELVRRGHERIVTSHEHQHVPFERIVAAVGGSGAARSPVFQSTFLLQNFPVPDTGREGLTLRLLPLETGAARFDLSLVLSEGEGGIDGELQYRADLWREDTVRALAAAYGEWLETLVSRPETRLSTLDPAAGRPRLECRAHPVLHLVASFTADPLAEVLEHWVETLDLPHQVVTAPYGQVLQQLLDPAGPLASDTPGTTLVLVRPEDAVRYAGGLEAADAETRMADYVDELIAALEAAVRHRGGRGGGRPTLLALCPPTPAVPADLHRRLEERLAGACATLPGVMVMGPEALTARYPVTRLHDAETDRLGHVPYTEEGAAALATSLLRRVLAHDRRPRKVLAVDADNTLWRGVVGEDGPLGVVVDAPHRVFQQALVARQRQGMLLALCSKNAESDVLEALDGHPDMVLSREHLVARRIDWNPKSENLRSLADELDLGLDAFVFLDDNPVECAEVAARLPQVLVLEVPGDDRLAKFLDHVWELDRVTVTDEDRRRTEMYRQNAARTRLREEAGGLEDFVARLELVVESEPLTTADPAEARARDAQLTWRTNQFNASTRRRTAAELTEALADGLEGVRVRVRDRFGDYGQVGLALYRVSEDTLIVDTLLLSCRVLGRGVEYRLSAELGGRARERGAGRVVIPFTATERNRPVRDFLESVATVETGPDGGTRYTLTAEEAAATRRRPAAGATASSLGEGAGSGTDFVEAPPSDSARSRRVALELTDAAAVARAVRRRAAARRDPAVPEERPAHVAPRTEIEEHLAAVWRDVLQIERVGARDHFFALGGHSLLGTQVIARASRRFGVELALGTLFEKPVLEDLATAVEDALIADASEAEIEAALRAMERQSPRSPRNPMEEQVTT